MADLGSRLAERLLDGVLEGDSGSEPADRCLGEANDKRFLRGVAGEIDAAGNDVFVSGGVRPRPDARLLRYGSSLCSGKFVGRSSSERSRVEYTRLACSAVLR